MVTKAQGNKTRKVNVWLTDNEWRRWRLWLVKHNHSGSVVVSAYIRRIIGRSVQKRTKVLQSDEAHSRDGSHIKPVHK